MAESARPREAAARAVAEVLGGRSLADALPRQLKRLHTRDKALAQELAYGALRWAPRLQALLRRMLDKPLKDREVEAVLLVGLYQLAELSTAEHAAVSETVSAVAALGKGWARGLVNAVLRRFQREGRSLLGALDRDAVARTAHPKWLLDSLRRDWPEHWEAIADANNGRPPMTLRVNRAQGSRSAYAAQLADAGITARPNRHCADALTLDRPVPVEQLPGFADGAVSVQDAAAQLAATLLDIRPDQRVLDACAAPGGKTGHLLETSPGARVLALDSEAARLRQVEENLGRLRLNAAIQAGDAGRPDTWWDGEPFDRILLDAPCSGTGVIRRHPDIKLLRRASDIPALAASQAKLLRALWPLLRPGGMLVYATCSILRDENDRQMARFLGETPDAAELPIAAEWGQPVAVGRQVLPGQDGMDGFYYARLAKR